MKLLHAAAWPAIVALALIGLAFESPTDGRSADLDLQPPAALETRFSPTNASYSPAQWEATYGDEAGQAYDDYQSDNDFYVDDYCTEDACGDDPYEGYSYQEDRYQETRYEEDYYGSDPWQGSDHSDYGYGYDAHYGYGYEADSYREYGYEADSRSAAAAAATGYTDESDCGYEEDDYPCDDYGYEYGQVPDSEYETYEATDYGYNDAGDEQPDDAEPGYDNYDYDESEYDEYGYDEEYGYDGEEPRYGDPGYEDAGYGGHGYAGLGYEDYDSGNYDYEDDEYESYESEYQTYDEDYDPYGEYADSYKTNTKPDDHAAELLENGYSGPCIDSADDPYWDDYDPYAEYRDEALGSAEDGDANGQAANQETANAASDWSYKDFGAYEEDDGYEAEQYDPYGYGAEYGEEDEYQYEDEYDYGPEYSGGDYGYGKEYEYAAPAGQYGENAAAGDNAGPELDEAAGDYDYRYDYYGGEDADTGEDLDTYEYDYQYDCDYDSSAYDPSDEYGSDDEEYWAEGPEGYGYEPSGAYDSDEYEYESSQRYYAEDYEYEASDAYDDEESWYPPTSRPVSDSAVMVGGVWIDLCDWFPDELLTAEDQAQLCRLQQMFEEPWETRRDAWNNYVIELGPEAIALVLRLEETTSWQVLELADDLPGAAAFLAAFRLMEQDELTVEDGAALLDRALGNLPEEWVEEVSIITLQWPQWISTQAGQDEAAWSPGAGPSGCGGPLVAGALLSWAGRCVPDEWSGAICRILREAAATWASNGRIPADEVRAVLPALPAGNGAPL